MKDNSYKTINTFTRKPCINQIISYLIIITSNISFFGFVQLQLNNQTLRFILISLYLITLVVIIIFTWITSYKDPSDPIMIQYRNSNKQKKYKGQIQTTLLFCQYCDSYVCGQSKHCKLCDRCVQNFDHHCIWINNCIGKSNYKQFLIMIMSTFIHFSLYLISVSYLWYQGNWGNFLSSMIFTWIISFVVIIFYILLVGLIALHLYLLKIGMTTFDYVYQQKQIQNRKKAIEKQKKQQIGQSRQITAENNENINKSKQQQKINTQQQINATNNIIKTNGEVRKQNNIFMKNNLQFFQQNFQNKDELVKKKKLKSLFKQQIEREQFENFDDVYKNHKSLKLLVSESIIVRPNKGIERRNSLINSKLQIKQLDNNKDANVKKELHQ